MKGFRVQGVGFRVSGVGCRGLGCMVQTVSPRSMPRACLSFLFPVHPPSRLDQIRESKIEILARIGRAIRRSIGLVQGVVCPGRHSPRTPVGCKAYAHGRVLGGCVCL